VVSEEPLAASQGSDTEHGKEVPMRWRRHGHFGLTTVTTIAVILTIVAAYPLSVGPVFDYYGNKNPAAATSPTARAIFKAYIPLYEIAPDAASWYVGKYAGLSDIETYFLMHAPDQYWHLRLAASVGKQRP
jgi:hypothetical protein